ncbi:MAG: uncharacterized protein H6Q92_457 [Nitrospirae bacterium]|nr:uncharacterized protein [Nitrospirota bacterium]
MKNMERIAIIILMLTLPLLLGASNENETKDSAGQIQEKNPTDKHSDQKKIGDIATTPNVTRNVTDKPLYKPPLRGSPAGRVGGGTRGTERESFLLMVLAPDHVGLTIHDQPSLYWFISKPTTYPVELTVIERNAVQPLLEKILKSPEKGGIQSLRLADYGVRLRIGIQYKWFVTLVTDAAHRSKDILAGGIITLVDAPLSLPAKLESAGSSGAYFVYAEEGLWYDSLDAVSRMIDAAPTNLELHKQRAALLEQVGLSEVAAFEDSQQPSSR